MEGQERLDEVRVDSEFKLREAIDSLKFYWNLARHRGEPVIMEVWGAKKPSPKKIELLPVEIP